MHFTNDQTAKYLPPSNGRRCNSAPPYSIQDIGQNYDYPVGPNREFADKPLWHVEFPLDSYTDVVEVHDYPKFPQARVLILDWKSTLKMMSPLVDISSIVSIMRLAATVVPVPQVYEFGFSGNCSYIIMEYVPGFNLGRIAAQFPLASHIVAPQVSVIIQKLASVGLSHNDLEPRNILIDSSWRIVSLLDWDLASSSSTSTDYARRVLDTTSPGWNYFFLQNSGRRGVALDLNPVDGDCLMKNIIPPPAPSGARVPIPSVEEVSLQYAGDLSPTMVHSRFRIAIVVINSSHIVSAALDAIEGLGNLASVCAVISEDELNTSTRARLPPEAVLRAGHPLSHEIASNYAFSSIAYTRPHMVLIGPDFPSKLERYIRAINETPVELVTPPFHPVVFQLRTSYLPRRTPKSAAPDDQWAAKLRCTASQLWVQTGQQCAFRTRDFFDERTHIARLNEVSLILEEELTKAVVTSVLRHLETSGLNAPPPSSPKPISS